jgi:choice-of-anchor B domain-containing protein
MLKLIFNAVSAAALLATTCVDNVFAHGDSGPLFVAENGEDVGNCRHETAPCATIGYALKFAGKGDKIRVAEGTYVIDKSEDVFHLVSGAIDAAGGLSKDGFDASESGVSILSGVPYEYRKLFLGRGFRIIADRKAIDGSDAAAMLQVHQQLRSSIAATPCVDGMAGQLPCSNVDLLSHVGFDDMSVATSAGTDVWGFVDLNSGREYALAGFDTGVAVIDVSNAENPHEVGFIDAGIAIWRDIKVYQFFDAMNDRWQAYAYVTTDGGGPGDGLFIIDLTGLPHSVSRVDYENDIVSAHNVYATNTDYATGLSLTGDTPELIVAGSNIGSGQYRTYSLADPTAPVFVNGATGSGYMHDASSMMVTDGRMNSQCANATTYCQVLIDFNENSIEFWDITDSGNPVNLSDTPYVDAEYVHSGWWSEDKQYLFVHDEQDEQQSGLPTTLRVFSLANLAAPVHVGTWSGSTGAVDHNGFVRGNRYYMSNYSRGLTILDITDPISPVSVGRLDTYPFSDGQGLVGLWGAFPFFFSGNVAVHDIHSGFYMARDNTRDVPEGSFSFAVPSTAVDEGQLAQMAVQRKGGSTGAVSVNYELLSATAESEDYQVTSGVLNWGSGDTAVKNIAITATNDGVLEGIEHVIVRLISPSGGATLANLSTASLYISDPGAASSISFVDPIIETTEYGHARLVAILKRRGAALGAVRVDYSMTAGDAIVGTDFQGSTSGTVTWVAGDGNPKVLEFSISDDAAVEVDEFFQITLNNLTGATVVGSPRLTAIIRDASGVNLPPTANAGTHQEGASRTRVTLDGSQSSDPNGAVPLFEWVQTSGPTVALNDAGAAATSFTAPTVASDTLLHFDLTVTDAGGLSDSASTTVTVTPSSSSGIGGMSLSLLGLLLLRRRRGGAPTSSVPQRPSRSAGMCCGSPTPATMEWSSIGSRCLRRS